MPAARRAVQRAFFGNRRSHRDAGREPESERSAAGSRRHNDCLSRPLRRQYFGISAGRFCGYQHRRPSRRDRLHPRRSNTHARFRQHRRTRGASAVGPVQRDTSGAAPLGTTSSSSATTRRTPHRTSPRTNWTPTTPLRRNALGRQREAIDDPEERLAIYRAISNIVTTRTDVYIAWFVLRSYHPDIIEGVTVDAQPGSADSRRHNAMNGR